MLVEGGYVWLVGERSEAPKVVREQGVKYLRVEALELEIPRGFLVSGIPRDESQDRSVIGGDV